MTPAKVDTLAWVAIYLGMILVGLGLSLQRHDASFGWGVTAFGGLGIAVGIVLIWLRSRMHRAT